MHDDYTIPNKVFFVRHEGEYNEKLYIFELISSRTGIIWWLENWTGQHVSGCSTHWPVNLFSQRIMEGEFKLKRHLPVKGLTIHNLQQYKDKYH